MRSNLQDNSLENEKNKMKMIEALLELYLFNQNMKKEIDDNTGKVFEGKCLLLNEKLIPDIQKFDTNEEIFNYLSGIINISENNKELIIKEIYENHKNKFNNINENKIHQQLIDINKKYFEFDYKINNNPEELVVLDKYSLINIEIFQKIISDDFNVKDIMIYDYIINNKKLILKYRQKNIIIGNISFINFNNKLEPEIFLDYLDENIMNTQFNHFKTFINDLKNYLKLKGDNVENIINNNSNTSLGKAYFIKNSFSKPINNNVDIYIKILWNIFYNYEYINHNINKKFESEQQFEICYIINKNYILKVKEVLNYKHFCEYKIKEKIGYYKIKGNNFDELLNNNEIIEEIKKDIFQTKFAFSLSLVDKEIFNQIKNDYELINIKKNYLVKEGLYYYNNFEIISKNLYEILNEYNMNPKNEYMIETLGLFGENNIIFYPTSLDKNNLIIACIDYKQDFIPEIV